LAFKDWSHRPYRFDLDEHLIGDDDVGAVGAVHLQAAINERKRLLSLDLQASPGKVVAQTCGVCALEKAGSELAMDADCSERWSL
jgi:hypothetical protein